MQQNDIMLEILKIVNSLKDDIQQCREDIKQCREDIKQTREELTKFREESEKRWEENQKRWEENKKRWEENEKRWDEYRKNRKKDKEDIINILWSFQTSIEKMFEAHDKRITRLEDQFNNMTMSV